MTGSHQGAAEWALNAKQVRFAWRDRLSAGESSLVDVVGQAAVDPLVGRIKLLWILESLPGAGKVATRRKLAALGIREATPIGELGPDTLGIVMVEFADPPTLADRAGGGDEQR